MQPVDRNIHMFFSIKTHMYTNTSSIKLPYIISWKHHTHKVNAIHAHASFRSLWEVSSRFRYRSLGMWAPSFHWPNSMGREPPLRSVLYAICLCLMLNNILYSHFHDHAFNTCFQYKSINSLTHQFINQYLRNLNHNRSRQSNI
jgi:hypothetical protein